MDSFDTNSYNSDDVGPISVKESEGLGVNRDGETRLQGVVPNKVTVAVHREVGLEHYSQTGGGLTAEQASP